MKYLSISNFKGIVGTLTLDLKNENGECKNYLLYSENGGGKTSIAEAIRLAVCFDAVQRANIPPHYVGINRAQAIQSFLAGKMHDTAGGAFHIKIDSYPEFTNASTTRIPVDKDFFILGRKELSPSSRLNMSNLLNEVNIRHSVPMTDYMTDENIDLVIDEVNKDLHDVFKEDISIVRLQEPGLFIGICYEDSTMHFSEGIDTVLNEARQNLIKILLFLNFLKCLPATQDKEDKCIVLDDIMSSLDLANRIILARYIVNLGRHYQILVFTHNVGFYNLMRHTVSVENVNDSWINASLYRMDGKEEIYIHEKSESIEDLMKKYGGKILPTKIEAINEMRKKFEFLLHEFGKILTLGIQEETKNLIGHLVSSADTGYYCSVEGDNIKTGNDLIKKISALVNDERVRDLKEKIKYQLQKYDMTNEMRDIAETIRHLHTYQKVVLHPGSHDQGYAISFTSEKEITLTIDLMKKLESIVNRSSSSYPYFL